MNLKSIISIMALLIGLVAANAQEKGYYLSGKSGLTKSDSQQEQVYFLPEEEVRSWCELDPKPLIDETYAKYGFTWHSIYEAMKRDSFAYVPMTSKKAGMNLTTHYAKKHLTHDRPDVCECPFETLILIHYSTPIAEGAEASGNGGLLPICRKHKKQFNLIVF